MLGFLIHTAGSPGAGEAREAVSELLTREPEFARAMLRLVQATCNAGALSEDEAHYLLYWITEQMSVRWCAEDAELERLTAAMTDIERRHGLSEGEAFHVDHAPADWTALSNEWEERLDTIWAQEFTRLGEPELARLMRTGELHDDPSIYAGRAALFARAGE